MYLYYMMDNVAKLRQDQTIAYLIIHVFILYLALRTMN